MFTQPLATSSILACLEDLEEFLESIQPQLDILQPLTKPTSFNTAMTDAIPNYELEPFQLYPALGPLLTKLCQIPIVLMAKPFVGLLMLSVLKYSNQLEDTLEKEPDRTGYDSASRYPTSSSLWTSRTDYQGGESSESNRVPDRHQRQSRQRKWLRCQQQRWCAQRLDDLFRLGSRKESHINLAVQSELVHIGEATVADPLAVIASATASLHQLEKIIASGVNLKSLQILTEWTRELTSLVAPIVQDARTFSLVENILHIAYTIHCNPGTRQSTLDQDSEILDNAFVQQLLPIMDGDEALEENECRFDDSLLVRLWALSSIARQQKVLELIDSIMLVSSKQPQFYMSRQDIEEQYLEHSQLLHVINQQDRLLSQEIICRILEDMADIASKIPDWRLTRIVVTITGWILERHGKNQSLAQDSHETAHTSRSTIDPDDGETRLLWDLLSTASALIRTSATSSALKVMEDQQNTQEMNLLKEFLRLQHCYIYESSGAGTLARRRRVVFVVATSISWKHNQLLTWIPMELSRSYQGAEMKMAGDRETGKKLPISPVISFMTLLLLSEGTTEIADEKNDEESLVPRQGSLHVQLVMDRLQELFWLIRRHCVNADFDTNVTDAKQPKQRVHAIAQVFIGYQCRWIYRFNMTLVADLICAVSLTISPKDPGCLNVLPQQLQQPQQQPQQLPQQHEQQQEQQQEPESQEQFLLLYLQGILQEYPYQYQQPHFPQLHHLQQNTHKWLPCPRPRMHPYASSRAPSSLARRRALLRRRSCRAVQLQVALPAPAVQVPALVPQAPVLAPSTPASLARPWPEVNVKRRLELDDDEEDTSLSKRLRLMSLEDVRVLDVRSPFATALAVGEKEGEEVEVVVIEDTEEEAEEEEEEAEKKEEVGMEEGVQIEEEKAEVDAEMDVEMDLEEEEDGDDDEDDTLRVMMIQGALLIAVPAVVVAGLRAYSVWNGYL
ncbi:hypothetical protein BGW38_005679 [Lunasporangiospora selenospora]|uniref:Uncharacterized protein n=1 Tax=Lunasporangiospora selenospora TaxID=979761 RepID=A0A9P6G2P8_9FUNG|nr:hypothetical protein BGW38_005679 [Lunasporangiospora selenospora]